MLSLSSLSPVLWKTKNEENNDEDKASSFYQEPYHILRERITWNKLQHCIEERLSGVKDKWHSFYVTKIQIENIKHHHNKNLCLIYLVLVAFILYYSPKGFSQIYLSWMTKLKITIIWVIKSLLGNIYSNMRYSSNYSLHNLLVRDWILDIVSLKEDCVLG